MGDGRSIFFFAVVIFIFVLLFLYALAESALTEFPNQRVKALEHEKGAKRALFKLLKKPAKLHVFFTQMRIVTTIWVSVWSLRLTLLIPIGDLFIGFPGYYSEKPKGIYPFVMFAIFLLCFIVIALVFESVFVHALPRRIVWNMTPERLEATALFFAPLIRLTLILFTPFIALSTAAVTFFSWCLGLKNQADTEVTEEEILMMVDVGTDSGAIEESEAEMISGIFEFSDTPASDIMTHRTDIIGIRDTAAACDIAAKSADSGHSRLPVYKGSIDRIIGIINVKDLLPLIIDPDKHSGKTAADYLRPVIYVPESATAKNIFGKLTESKMQMAVITDEYGGTSGIVTIEDLLETIVGSIQDEYDDESEEIRKVDEQTYIIDGLADPKDVFEMLSLPVELDEFSEEDFDSFDTMSALLIELSGALPDKPDDITVSVGDFVFTAMSVTDMRITKIKAEKKQAEPENNIEDNEKSE
jgi:putative hemolysin